MSRPRRRYFEEYHCGCVSEVVSRKKDLLGYCPKHGEDRRRVHVFADAERVAGKEQENA